MNNKIKKELEELATKLTEIEPIKDFEYRVCTYEKSTKGKTKQIRKNLFKSSKRII